MKQTTSSNSSRLHSSSFPRFTRLAMVSALALSFGAFIYLARAAAPAEATIGPDSAGQVTWVGTAPGGASAGEATCVDGVNCDVFKITVTGAKEDWTTKIIALNFTWTLPANDYDFYIHKDAVDGPITSSGRNDGAPATDDNAAIDPASSGVGDYFVHVVYFSVVGADQYKGSAAVQTKSTEVRTATYTSSGIQFSKNVTVKAPVAARDGEPSIRTDYKGNSYTGGIRGVPAGVDLWYFNLNPNSVRFDPEMRVPAYRGQPDGFTEKTPADAGGDGGGDIDLAVGFPPLEGQSEPKIPILAYSSLTLANIPTGLSRDRGRTFEFNNVGNLTGGPPGDDRQWHEFLGSQSVYLLYRTVAPAIAQIQRSDDGGFTYGPAASAGLIGQVGCLDVHQATGTVYASGNSGSVAVGTPSVPGQAPTTADYIIRPAASDPNGVANIFFVVKVADDGTPNGTAYVVYSNGQHVFLKSSKDKGASWSAPVRVNPPAGPHATKVNLFPWMETGPTPGSVGVVWYGTTHDANNDDAKWKVYYALSYNADTAKPAFNVAEVTEPKHVIHGSNISLNGLDPTAPANRNLIDYFQVSFDPQGAAVIAYTDDHNDFDGNTYVARQIAGPSINGGNLGPQNEGKLRLPAATASVEEEDVFPPRQPGLNGEQVTDFERDVQTALVTRVPTPDPLDIESVRYDTSGTGESLAIAASMRVTDLTVIPPGSFWRASFAVNAPNSVLSADGTYTYGISDDGDQFYVVASVGESGDQTFSYGTAVRNPDGTITYTRVGDADVGEFNTDTQTINIQVSVAKLNEVLAAADRPRIQHGSVVAGLRARGVTADVGPPVNRQGRRDITRGGTQFVVTDFAQAAPSPTPSPSPLPPRAVTPGETPAPTPPEIELANISTRVAVGAGEQVGIGGFIVRSNASKRVVIRGIGPSIGVPGALQDPLVEVRDAGGAIIATNNNWRGESEADTNGGPSQQAEITASGLAPRNNLDAAVIVQLPGDPEGYTVTLRAADGTQGGIGLVEVYDLDAGSFADLGNISTRGQVGTEPSVLIGGFIVRDDSSRNRSQDILIRAIGPSLSDEGVQNPLADPELSLVDQQGTVIASNNNWRSDQPARIEQTGIPPKSNKESAIRRTLAPGAYTCIVRGVGGTTGVGLVEVYNLGNK